MGKDTLESSQQEEWYYQMKWYWYYQMILPNNDIDITNDITK